MIWHGACVFGVMHSPFARLGRRRVLRPTIDVVFKALFTKEGNEDLLRDLLEACLDLEAPIVALEVLDRTLPKELPFDKELTVDVRVRLANGDQVIVEMQCYPEPHVGDRFVYYAVRGAAQLAARGERYEDVPRVRLVALMLWDPFGTPGPRTTFLLRDPTGAIVLSRGIEVTTVHLPRARRLDKAPTRSHTRMEFWARFFLARRRTEYEALAKKDPMMKRATEALVDLSQDRDWDVIVKSRETNDFMRVWAREKEKREVAAKSRVEGRVEGEATLLECLLAKKFGALPPEVVARLRGAGTVELEAWGERLLDAASLAEVFEVGS